MRCVVVGLVLLLATVTYASAQTFVLVGTDASEYPRIKARAYGFSTTGFPQFITSATATVDGQTAPVTASSESAGPGVALSCMVMVDGSSSLDLGTPNNLELAKAVATAAPSVFNTTADEIGLGMFDARPTLLHGLTTDRASYTSAIADIRKGNGCNVDSALLGNPEGAMTHLRSARNARMLLLVLDGAPSVDLTTALRVARGYRIPVYIIGMRTSLTDDLRALSDSSGGLYVENIATTDDAIAYTRAFVSRAKLLPASILTVDAAESCDTVRTLAITAGSTVRTTTLTIPSLELPTLEWSIPGGLEFGPGSNISELTVTLTARVKAVGISDLTIDDNRFFLVTPFVPLVLLQPDQSMVIKIGYRGGAEGAFGYLTPTSDACKSEPLALRAGGFTSGETLQLVSPNGGEQVLAGRVTPIRWTNVLPSDVVRLDVSMDNGNTWLPITETATGLQYDWVAGPGTSNNARIRVQRTAIVQEAVVTMQGHREPVYGVAFTYDGLNLITAGHDGTVRMWNATTGEQVRELGSHTGNWAWSVATHRSQRIAASGGHDGTVRVYDLATGARLATILAPSRVWSVDFSADGKYLVIGSEKALTIVNWSTGQNANTIVVDGGPVYNARYSRDGTKIITAEGNQVVVRSASTYQIERSISTGSDVVYTADLSPDNSTIASGGADFKVTTWDAASGAKLGESPLYTAAILAVDFAPSGARIVAGCGDGAAKIFLTSTLELVSSLTLGPNLVYSARFDNTGNRIATGGTDAMARVWNLQGATLSQDEGDGPFQIRGGTIEIADVQHGSINVGDGTERRVTVVKNIGSDSLVVGGWRLVSGNLDQFDVLTPSTPRTLAGGESFIVETVCQPRQAENVSAALRIEHAGTFGISQLTGTGRPQPLEVPDVVNFGRRIAGQESVDSTIRIKAASGTAQVSITRIVLRGVQQGAYQIVSGGDPVTLNPAQTHTMIVRFAPNTFGRYAAWIEMTLADGSVRIMRLYGEGAGDARIVISESTLLYVSDQCSSSPITKTFTVRNGGTSTLVLFSGDVTGTHANEFTLVVSQQFPISLAQNQTATFDVVFTPTIVGQKDASVTIASNAIDAVNGVNVIPIIARKDSVGFELSRDAVLFDNVNEGQSAEQRITIFNTGSVPLRWPTTGTDVGDFRVEAAIPPVTAVGGSSEVVVRFKGGVVGNTYSGSYVFLDTLCNRSATLQMSATVRSYIGCTIVIDSVAAAIGSTVQIPVRVTNKVNFDRTQVTELNARFRVNGTILSPVGLPSSFEANGQRLFDVTLPIPQSGDVSATLQFNVTWGNDTMSIITIDSVWVADTIQVRTDPGAVWLSDLCKAGGPRLIFRSGAPSAQVRRPADVRIVPQPTSDYSVVDLHVVEDGPTRVDVIDESGRLVQTLVNRDLTIGDFILLLDSTRLKNGTYTLQLTTRTQRMSHRFTVLR